MSDYSATFPSQRPVFNADFSNSSKIDPRATFSRSDSPIDATKAAASAVHYWSNEKHLSSENLLTDSNGFPAYATSNVATPSASGSFIDGTDAFVVTETTANGYHFINSTSGQITSGTSYTATVFVKPGTASSIQMLFNGNVFPTTVYANYDLSTPTNAPVTGADATATSTGLSDGWVKITLSGTATGSGSYPLLYLVFNNDDINSARLPTYTPSSAKNYYVWEANVSTTGEKVLNQTSGSIHRQYASTLKSVSTAGQPRFEYGIDGQSAGTSLGCLIESQATNLYGNSLDMTGVSQARTNIDLNVAVGPTGQLTADAIRLDATNSDTHTREYSFTAAASTAYTFSVYLKAAGMTHAVIRPNNLFAESYVYFNLSNGTVEGSPTLANSMTAVGNGFYRCSVTATTSGSGAGSFNIYITDSASSTTVATGDSYRAILGQGIQIEAGSHPSSFIQTSGGSTATRASDSLSVDLTQAGFNGGPSSVVVEMDGGAGDFPSPFCVSDGSTSNQYRCFRNSATATSSTDYRFRYYVDGTSYVNRTASSSNAAAKIGMSVDTNSVITCFDGGNSSTDTSAPLVTMTQLDVGGFPGSVTQKFDGTCKRIAVYGTALSQTELEALTS